MLTFPVNILSPAGGVQFVGAGALSAISSGTALTVNMPGGLVAGDLVVVVTGASSGTELNISSVTTGYAQRINGNNFISGGEECMDIWTKTAGGGEGSATVNFDSSDNMKLGVALAYRNVASITVAPAVNDGDSAAFLTTNNWTDNSGFAVVAWLANRNGANDINLSVAPVDMTQRAFLDGDVLAGGGRQDLHLYAYDLRMASRGSINRTLSVNQSDVAWISGGIGLRA
jgi:hypothetical protein